MNGTPLLPYAALPYVCNSEIGEFDAGFFAKAAAGISEYADVLGLGG